MIAEKLRTQKIETRISPLEFTKSALHPTVRWLDEFSAKNRFEGNTFLITIGYIIKSLKKKEEKG